MNSVNNQPNYFDLLNGQAIGAILDQLNQITGSKGIVNKADIPVIVKYVKSLGCTNKRMAAALNDPRATQILLNSLSRKYGQPCEELAAKLDTRGARLWLWNYIIEKGDDVAYQIIQDIYKVASNILLEAKRANIVSENEKSPKETAKPNPFYYQTKQGFNLYINWAPTHLATPFGQVKILEGLNGKEALAISEALIGRLNALLERIEFTEGNRVYEIQAPSIPGVVRSIHDKQIVEISREKFMCKKGTQNLVVNSMSGMLSEYRIRKVVGVETPDVMMDPTEQTYRSNELINKIWKMLEQKKLGLNPIEVYRTYSKAVVEKVKIEPMFNNISEVSSWAVGVVAELEKQPLFAGKTWFDMPTKLLVLEDFGATEIIKILNTAAEKFLGQGKAWPIENFGCGNNNRSLNGKDLGYGLELWLSENEQWCDIINLKKAYDLVLESIGQNWIRSELEDYPEILPRESEEDYVLYVKKENVMPNEANLIAYLAERLGISEYAQPGENWTSRGKLSPAIYLWIRKNNLEIALQTLNINPV